MNQVSVELVAPDISRWATGNTGTPFVWRFESGQPGPEVMVQALTHGNEICGAIAMDWLLSRNFRPQKGQLTLAFGNVAAFARWDPNRPAQNRYVDEDFNRIWADQVLFSDKDSVERARGRELLPFVEAADFLLDIHSMHEPCVPMMVCGTGGKGAAKAMAMSEALGIPRYLMFDVGHPAGLRMIERGGFSNPESPKVALLIECGQHWESAAAVIAKEVLLRFLRQTGTLASASVEPYLNPTLSFPERTVIEVTHVVVAKSLDFRFAADYRGLEVIPKKGDPIAFNGDEVVRAPYDQTVLVMPAIAKQWEVGTTMVRLGRFA